MSGVADRPSEGAQVDIRNRSQNKLEFSKLQECNCVTCETLRECIRLFFTVGDMNSASSGEWTLTQLLAVLHARIMLTAQALQN